MSEDSNGDGDDRDLVDRRTRMLVDRILFVLGMTMFVVGLVGEIRGWWDAVGVIVSLGGLLVGLFSAMDRNGLALLEGQSTTHAVLMRIASDQAKARGTQSEMLGNQEAMLGNQEAMLGNQEAMLGNQESMLANQEAMLGNQEEMIAILADIADTLDERLPDG